MSNRRATRRASSAGNASYKEPGSWVFRLSHTSVMVSASINVLLVR